MTKHIENYILGGDPNFPAIYPINFHCHVCGAECSTKLLPGVAVCEDHCPDHDYRYERGEGGCFCVTCNQRRPDDWFVD